MKNNRVKVNGKVVKRTKNHIHLDVPRISNTPETVQLVCTLITISDELGRMFQKKVFVYYKEHYSDSCSIKTQIQITVGGRKIFSEHGVEKLIKAGVGSSLYDSYICEVYKALTTKSFTHHVQPIPPNPFQ